MLLKLHSGNQALAGWRHYSASMIGMGENQLRAQAVRAGLLDVKTRFTIGSWNVRTMFDTSRTMQVIQEIQNYKLSLYIYPLDRWTQLRWKGFEQIITWTQKKLFCLREGMTNNLGLNLRQSSLFNKNTLQLKMANWLRVTLTESQPVN